MPQLCFPRTPNALHCTATAHEQIIKGYGCSNCNISLQDIPLFNQLVPRLGAGSRQRSVQAAVRFEFLDRF